MTLGILMLVFCSTPKMGIRVSLLEMLDDISFLYNVVMFQINRELAKAKGKAVAYDLAGLPKGQTVKDVMYNLTDDGLYLYNSSQEGNKIGRDVMVQGTIKEIDLGVSNTIAVLLPLKNELQLMADRLTGITEERQGQIAASSTVTNAQSNIVASQDYDRTLCSIIWKDSQKKYLQNY